MHIVAALAALIGGAVFWIYRVRGAADAASELMDVANDVRLAARRFGFRRRHGEHPVESIDDPHVAVAGLAVSFLELDALPTHEQQIALGRGLQTALKVSLTDAEELMVLGRWLMTECGGAQPAIARLARRLYKLDSAGGFDALMSTIREIAGTGSGLSQPQTDALAEIKRAFRLS